MDQILILCQQLQEERLRGALGHEKDAACFTFSWLDFVWLCGHVMFSHHTLDSNRVTADWHEESSAAIDQVIKATSHVWISESSSWLCVFIDFWSWVIFTSCPGSKESRTGLMRKSTNAFNNNHVLLRKRISWLIAKHFIYFWHFVLTWRSQQNITS